MSLPPQLLTTTCDVYRPFGAGAATFTGVPCRLVSCLERGRGATTGPNYLTWTDYIDVDDTVDVRDGCSRSVGSDHPNYADGDEVRIPTGGSTSNYVVVWVTLFNRGSSMAFKRAYLLRHTAVWPGP
jgi:hypothetical protein